MYAIIKTGGKQIKAEVGKAIFVEKLPVEENTTYTFNEVLLISGEETVVGSPVIEGAKVVCDVVKQGRNKKIIVFKYRPKTNYRKKNGHRQPFTKLIVKEIVQ